MNSYKIRILCLHGWRTNKKVIEYQTLGIRNFLNDEQVEFVYVNGTHNASGPAMDEVIQFFGKNERYYEWWNAVEKDNEVKYIGMNETLDYIANIILQKGPFDILLGFSQGTILTTILNIRELENNNNNNRNKWKLIINVSGLPPQDEIYKKILKKEMIYIPSIHIIGKKDKIYNKSIELLDLYKNSEYNDNYRKVYIHEEGHKFPSIHLHEHIYKEIADLICNLHYYN